MRKMSLICAVMLLLCANGVSAQAVAQSHPEKSLVQIVAERGWTIKKGFLVYRTAQATGVVHKSRKTVLTNAHLVLAASGSIYVEGIKVVSVKLGTDAQDLGAETAESQAGDLKLNNLRDMAELTLESPLPDKFIPTTFADYQLEVGQPVTRLSRNGKKVRRAGGIITELGFGTLKNRAGETYVAGHIWASMKSDPGDSGGILVDEHGRVIGLVHGIEIYTDPKTKKQSVTTGVLPTINVHHFLGLGNAKQAGNVAESQPEEEPKRPTDLRLPPNVSSPVIPEGTDRRAMVEKVVYQASIEAMDRLASLVADQRTTMKGNGLEGARIHGVGMSENGQLNWHTHGDQRVFEEGIFIPEEGLLLSNEWSGLLENLRRLPLQYDGVVRTDTESFHIFSYKKGRCSYAERDKKDEVEIERQGDVECSGQIIADEQFQPLQITQELRPPKDWITSLVKIAVRYDYQQLKETPEPVLLPTSFHATAKLASTWYSSYGGWGNYRRFRITVKDPEPTDPPR